MRVLIVCGTFPAHPSEDPVAPAHPYLARALKDLGHEVMVLSFTSLTDRYASEGQFDYHGITVHLVSPHVPLAWSTGLSIPVFAFHTNQAYILHKKFLEVVKEFNPDVIDCHEYNALGFYYARDHKYPLVVRCLGPLAHLMKSGDCGLTSHIDAKLVDLAELAPIAEADRVIACSADIASRASRSSGRPLSEFEIIKVPMRSSGSLPEKTEGLNKWFPKIFYFGRVERQKGVDLLLNCLPAIAKRYPDFHLTIGGSEPIEQGAKTSYADQMRQQLKEMGLSEKVTFLNQLSHAQIRQNVVDSDICVFPSKYETAGYACMEAVSYGGAVVATAVGGLPEYHKHGESVWLVPPNSSHELARGIIRLAEDEALRNKLRSKGFEYCAKVCDPVVIASASAVVYQQAIDAFKARKSDNRSFRIMADMLSALSEWHDPLAASLIQAQLQMPVASAPTPAVDAPNVVKILGELVLDHLSRVWKEGYSAGVEDGKNQAVAFQQNKKLSAGSLLHNAASKLKRKVRGISRSSTDSSD